MTLIPTTKQEDMVIINMEREVLTGNVLDIGDENSGVIYSLYKHYNDDSALEYLSGKEGKREIEKNSYDTCILLFTLRNILFKTNKKRLIKEACDYLKDNGIIHIWDIDKPLKKALKVNVKILLPENKTKTIYINEFNIFKDTSKESVLRLLKVYFEVIDFKCTDNIYYIKALKKGSRVDETSTSWNKLKIRTQQFSNKISDGIHKRN